MRALLYGKKCSNYSAKNMKPMQARYFHNFPTLQNLTFWHFHIGGWLLFWCGDVIIIWLQRIPPGEILAQAIDAPLAFLLGLILRQVYLRVDYKKISIIGLLALVAYWTIIITILWHGAMSTTRYHLVGHQTILRMVQWKFAIPWLAQTMPLWFGWSTLYFAIKYWRDWDAEKRRAQKAVSLAHRAQLQMLRYQVNPHFLFNALNSVRALIDEDKKNAKSMITELSEFLRYSLVTRDHTEVTVLHELDAIRHYLSIEKKRFEDKLDVTFEIDEPAQECQILSFLIHPFVENAVKYGMKTSPMPLRIRIHASVSDGQLRIVISNSGSWLNAATEMERKSNGTGTGLENVRARLENAYPNEYRLETKEHDGWVQAILEIRTHSSES
jgi:two-component sensor histidine kinase